MTAAASLWGQPAVLMWHNDTARTGQNLQETILTPANVNASMFGRLFTIPVDGKVDAQPLVVPALTFPGNSTHNVLYVETEHDSAYAFDADTGAALWHVSLVGVNETPSDDRGCFQVTPEIGITSTPAIDPSRGPHGTIYMVAMTKDGSGNYHQRLHALDLTTGGEEFGGPVEIRATYPGYGTEGSGTLLTFDPKQHKERAGLVIVNGIVYTSWSSHCDHGPYTGWLMGYDGGTLQQVRLLNMVPNSGEGSIWASGAAPAVDAAGNMFIPTANGRFDATLDANGFPQYQDYGNSFVKVSTQGSSLTLTDYFTMSNTGAESNADEDLGSGGLMLLPPLNDAQGTPRSLAVGGGKDSIIYVVDQSNLGRFSPQKNADYQQMSASQIFSSPAWFNGTLYYGSVGTTLKAFTFTRGAFGLASQSVNSFGYPGTTPSISANGTSNGIVWAAENTSPALLHAYDATDVSKELYNSNQAANARDHFGDGNKYIVPTVVNGKVYVGTTAGVGVFGLLQPPTPGPGPMPAPASITNAASFASSAIAPGELITIKGASLGPAEGVAFSLDPVSGGVDSLLAGTRVLFGAFAAPILYASATQVNVIVPYEVMGQSQVVVQVEYQGVRSSGTTLPVAGAAPGAFTFSQTGLGQAAAANLDGSFNSPSNPAMKGSYVTIYFTGGGATNPPGATGSVNGSVLKWLTQTPFVTVGGVPATVTFAGAAPGLVDGVNQLNIRLADNTPSGPALPVVIAIGGIASPPMATIAVQ